MDKFCIITNSDKDRKYKVTKLIQDYLLDKGKHCIISPDNRTQQMNQGKTDISWIEDGTDCVIVLGGDGTIIQAAADLAKYDIPLLAINLGTLGFLAEIEKRDILPALDCLIEDRLKIQERMMLLGKVSCDGKEVFEDYALNDIVISRSGFSRIISVNIYVNDELIDTYLGDGVLISTPTGSTGYNLSAGGPVAAPDAKIMMITPICSHSLRQRSIIVSSDDKVVAQIGKSKKTQKEEAIATFDSRSGVDLKTGDIIEIKKANEITKLIKINSKSFYEILRSKLG
ncbi:MAG TPA: NAD(+)/NADH kinase [Lachnospiraceae bacterium]|nr:NAD(+)/NADH kinase [Lachnospiraceae bacterium]